ncbi:MAG: MFS transporter [bacterium]
MEQNNLAKRSVFEGVKPYHWLVVIIASCGWLFDCMDQRIFVLTREPALLELLSDDPGALQQAQEYLGNPELRVDTMEGAMRAVAKEYYGWATFWMIIGWATGGIIFGMMSDKLGRVKTMVITLLIYSGFTGLSGLSHGWLDFFIYRFLVGLGVGGMFGAATTLVAESVPSGFRAIALGSLQALSATGNMMGSLISLGIPPGAENYLGSYSGWRILFFVGILPSLLVIPIIFILKEPEAWMKSKQLSDAGDAKHKMGSINDLFNHPRWRRNTLVGLMLGVSGMVGLWGIGFFSPELISTALADSPQEVRDWVRGLGTFLQDFGSLMGMFTFTFAAAYVSRRFAFLCSFILCLISTIFVFNFLRTPTDAYWMLPLMGFSQLAVFAGYSIYFPELFPTRLRGTGVGFCYNTVRYLAAPGPVIFGYLNTLLLTQGYSEPFRLAATLMSLIFILGMVALIWAPETKDQPLPED